MCYRKSHSEVMTKTHKWRELEVSRHIGTLPLHYAYYKRQCYSTCRDQWEKWGHLFKWDCFERSRFRSLPYCNGGCPGIVSYFGVHRMTKELQRQRRKWMNEEPSITSFNAIGACEGQLETYPIGPFSTSLEYFYAFDNMKMLQFGQVYFKGF